MAKSIDAAKAKLKEETGPVKPGKGEVVTPEIDQMVAKLDETQPGWSGDGTTIKLASLDQRETNLMLGDLIQIKNLPIRYGAIAQRNEDKENTASLVAAIQDGAHIPPIDVQPIYENNVLRYCILDGFHRSQAYALVAEQEFIVKHKGEIERAQEKGDTAALLDLNARKQLYLDAKPIRATILDFSSNPLGMVTHAIRANMKNGLTASKTTRGELGAILIREAAASDKKMSTREAGEQVGVSHVAVLNGLKKLAKLDRENASLKLLGDPLPSVEIPKTEEAKATSDDEGEASEGQKATSAHTRAARALFKAITTLCNNGDYEDEQFLNFLQGMKEDNVSTECVHKIGKLLLQIK